MLARLPNAKSVMPYFLLVDWKHALYFYYFLVCMNVHAYMYTILFEIFLDFYIYISIYMYISIYILIFFGYCAQFFLWPYLPKRSACEFSILHQKDKARDAHCKLMMVPLMLALP